MTNQLSVIIVALFVGGFSLSASSFPFINKHGQPNASTQASHHHERLFAGKAVPLGKGTIYSWVSFNGRRPASIGVTFTEAALNGLQTQPKQGRIFWWEILPPLPRQARVIGINHIAVDWNATGHVPPHIYDVPHFDFHFYLISQKERSKITIIGKDIEKASKKPPVEFIPQDYSLPPGTLEPTMGAHWIDLTSPEFHGKHFTHTLIYGFYDGKLAFVEPMITRAYLKTKPDITVPIKQPESFQQSGFYPTSYSIHYDPGARTYTISLSGLKPYSNTSDSGL